MNLVFKMAPSGIKFAHFMPSGIILKTMQKSPTIFLLRNNIFPISYGSKVREKNNTKLRKLHVNNKSSKWHPRAKNLNFFLFKNQFWNFLTLEIRCRYSRFLLNLINGWSRDKPEPGLHPKNPWRVK